MQEYMDKNRRRREHDNDVSPSIKLDFLVIKGDNVFLFYWGSMFTQPPLFPACGMKKHSHMTYDDISQSCKVNMDLVHHKKRI